jgi:hypothetical protein
MVFHPAIIALYVSSLLASFLISYSACFGIQILRKWDIQSSSEVQLILERKTYLISTILTYMFGFQLVALFLYVFTVDRLHSLFVGAMCAAGTLKVNDCGYPDLILKIAIFLLAGVWLIVNYADNRAYNYPLIKKKYLLLLILTPLVIAEMIFQAGYFLQLRPNIITSCCGSLFSTGKPSLTSELASLPILPMKIVFYSSIALTVFSGIHFFRKEKGGLIFSTLSGLVFLISMAAIISFISLYYYELPTHHCPFCILQKEYGYIGYPLYITLFSAAVAGIGSGLLSLFRKVKSLSSILPSIQRRLILVALGSFLIFAAMVTYEMIVSNLTLTAS